jgi:hypothetical protein
MMMIVDEKSSLFSLLVIASTSQTNIQTPEIKASLDKNKSQRIGDFRLK